MKTKKAGFGILSCLLFAVLCTTCFHPFGDIDPVGYNLNINNNNNILLPQNELTPDDLVEGPKNNPLLRQALLVVRNNADVNILTVTRGGADSALISDIPSSGNEKSAWLDPGNHVFAIDLEGVSEPLTISKVIIGGSKVNYLFVYKDGAGNYQVWDGTGDRPAEVPEPKYGGYIAVYNASDITITSIKITPPGSEYTEPPIEPQGSYTSEVLEASLPEGTLYELLVNTQMHVRVRVYEQRVSVIWYNTSITYPDEPGAGEKNEATGNNQATGNIDSYGYLVVNNNSANRTIDNIEIDGVMMNISVPPANEFTKGFKIIALDPKLYEVNIYEGQDITKSVMGAFIQSKDYFIINFPYDGADSSSTTGGAEIPAGKGSLVIQNKGPTNILEAFKVVPSGTPPEAVQAIKLAINPDNYRELILSPGAYDIYLKSLTSDGFGTNPFEKFEVRAGSVTTITYTDAQEDDRPHFGISGTLRVRNNSTYTITELVVFDPQYTDPEELHKSVSIPPSTSTFYIIKYGFYLARATTTEMGIAYVEQIVTLDRDHQIVDFIIDENSNKVVDDSISGGNTEKGGLRIYNAYGGGLPFKIFKIALQNTGNPDIRVDRDYTTMTQRYIAKGAPAPDFMDLDEGFYDISIVAGSYTWEQYLHAPSDTDAEEQHMREENITYDAGNIFIAKQTKKVFFFNPYNAALNDKDMPQGYVTVVFNHAGATGSTTSVLNRTQFISKNLFSLNGETPIAGGRNYETDGDIRFGTGKPKQTSSLTFTNSKDVPKDYVVIDDPSIVSVNSGSHTNYLPPSMFGMRVFDVILNHWYGRSSTHYLDLDIRQMAGQTVYLSWYHPTGLSITSEIDFDTTISELDLSDYVIAPVTNNSPQTDIDLTHHNGSPPGEYKGKIKWYKRSDSYLSFSSNWYAGSTTGGNYWNIIPSDARFESGKFYRAAIEIIPEEGITIKGVKRDSFTFKRNTYTYPNDALGNGNTTGNINNEANSAMVYINFTKTLP